MALGTALTTCPSCGLFHYLERHWYTFPELAPGGFVVREHIRMKVMLQSALSPQVEVGQQFAGMRHVVM